MKVLWITNNVMPFVNQQLGLDSSPSGSWILSLLDSLGGYKDIELAVATVYNCQDLEELDDGKIKYFLVPGKLNEKYYKKTEKFWRKLDSVFCADIVHLQGTEFYHGLAYLKALPNKKNVVSIQGLVTACSENYLAGISNTDIRKNITFRDIIRNDNLFQAQKKFAKRGLYEKEILRLTNNVVGRTMWDHSHALAHNPRVKYYHINEMMRDSFFNTDWNIKSIDKYTIYVSQAQMPLKGLHMLIKALSIVKEKYPNVLVKVAGNNITDTSTFMKKVKLSGYGKYLINLIKNDNLQDNISFLGKLSEKDVARNLSKSHITVVPSAIENSSNALEEALLVGTPTVSSYVGGIPSLVDENTSLTYPFMEYNVLAQLIIRLFEDDGLCRKLSSNGKKTARIRHNAKKITEDTYNLYKEILKSSD